jgi:hypothetical protein
LSLLAGGNVQAQSSPSVTKPFKLGFVKDEALLNDCGCSFYLSHKDVNKRRHVFLSDLSQNAIINLDAKDLRLLLIDHSAEKNDELKVGDRSWEIYRAGKVRLRVDYVVRKLCDPNDEGCEVIYYDATLSLTRDGQKAAFKVVGLCGC